MKDILLLIFLCSTLISNTLAAQQTSAVSVNELGSLNDLDDYEKLWIKPHGCVWSECAIDDADDGVMGDYRDGDSQWYQVRVSDSYILYTTHLPSLSLSLSLSLTHTHTHTHLPVFCSLSFVSPFCTHTHHTETTTVVHLFRHLKFVPILDQVLRIIYYREH
jgi:hypothetical protein